MKRTAEEAAQTQTAILDAALTTFSKVGYDAARLNDIAKSAGVTRGAIYHHFESKAGLFMALVQDASAIGGKAVQQAIQEGGSFVEVMARILIYSMELLEEDRRFREITALTLFKMGGSAELEDYRKQRIEESTLVVENIAGFFQMGIAQGEIRKEIDPQTAARAFLAFQGGLSMLWLTNPDAFSIKESAARLSEVFLHGVAN